VSVLALATLRAGAPSGVSAALATLVYATGRFGLESLREEPRFLGERFTRGQLASAFLAAAALALLLLEPSGFASSPAPALVLDLGAAWRELPVIGLVFAVVFAICGYHRGAVGRW
jgi:drug/metabolite transporter (DMT)-like permease